MKKADVEYGARLGNVFQWGSHIFEKFCLLCCSCTAYRSVLVGSFRRNLR